jgi:hypothetical protein
MPKKSWRVSLSAIVLVLALGDSAIAQQTPSLASVRKIHVGSMGQSDEANRFRLLLEEELQKAGFDTVGDARAADAELSGVMTVLVYDDTSLARATVALKTADGQTLWEHDFEPHAHLGGNDTVKLRAQDVAKALRNIVLKNDKEARKTAKNSTKTTSAK